jgi:hypothetical protein
MDDGADKAGMSQELMESEREMMRGIPMRADIMQRAREWVRDKFGGADRVPVAIAFRRNDAQLLEWRGPGMQCGPHHYWENCLNTCYQTANFSASVVRYADSVIPQEHRPPQGKPQVFISVRTQACACTLLWWWCRLRAALSSPRRTLADRSCLDPCTADDVRGGQAGARHSSVHSRRGAADRAGRPGHALRMREKHDRRRLRAHGLVGATLPHAIDRWFD